MHSRAPALAHDCCAVASVTLCWQGTVANGQVGHAEAFGAGVVAGVGCAVVAGVGCAVDEATGACVVAPAGACVVAPAGTGACVVAVAGDAEAPPVQHTRPWLCCEISEHCVLASDPLPSATTKAGADGLFEFTHGVDVHTRVDVDRPHGSTRALTASICASEHTTPPAAAHVASINDH